MSENEDNPQEQPGTEEPQQEQASADTQRAHAYSNLVSSLLDKLEYFFSDRCVDLFKNADEYLFEHADKAANIAEQNETFEFMNALRAEKNGIERRCIAEISKLLKPVSVLKELPSHKRHSDSDQLGLIDQDEMDEMVALTTISSKAAQDFREEFSHLEARLQHLALQDESAFHAGALSPKRICDAMQEALVMTEFSTLNKLILYKLFGNHVVYKLKKLYDELNQLMIDAGILPQIELSGKIKKSEDRDQHFDDYEEEDIPEETPPAGGGYRGGRGGGARAGHGGAGQGGAPGGPQGGSQGGSQGAGGYGGGSGGTHGGAGGYAGGGGGSAAAAGGGGGAPGAATEGGAGASGGYQGGGYGGAGGTGAPGMAGGGGGSPGAAGGAVSPSGPAGPGGAAVGEGSGEAAEAGQAGAGGGYVAGMPVNEVRDSIRNFVGGVPGEGDAEAGGGGGGGGVYYTNTEVVTALSELQNQAPASAPGAPLEFNAGAIKKAVLSKIGEKEGGAVTKAVNQVSEKTIDFIKLIFDAIIDEKSITDAIKALLLSLQIPVIKAAMLDAEFFVDDMHPARQLLDKIAEAGVGVSDHTDPVYIDIQAIVTRLLKDYSEDVVAFTVALDELKALTERIYQEAREKEQISQKEVKHTHARNVVLREIRKITIGKELPKGVRTLVLKIWPSLMFNHYLRHGKANDEWVEMLMILDKIIDSVQPLHSRQELEELGLSYGDIVGVAREKLRRCRKSQAIIDQVIEDLRHTYEDLLQTEIVQEEEPAPVEEAAAEEQPEGPEETETPAAEALEEAEVETELAAHEEPVEAMEVETEMLAAETEAEAEAAPAKPDFTQEDEAEVEARRKIAALPNDVQPGAWFIVYNGEDKPVRRLKLAVILVQDASLVFVDHLGNVVIEKDAGDFSDEIERGLSGVIMQHSVFDHALKSALESIKA